jgi:hypothetical protein
MSERRDSLAKWYESLVRYGQTNLTEIDPIDCDIEFWKDFWKRTSTQAIIVNASGIVAYYPSRFPLQYRAAKLGSKDFFGEFVKAGRESGLAILARMDINRASRQFYDSIPEWFAVKKDGSPYEAQGRYQSCLNSGYYKDYIPEVLKEIIELYHPDGFTDNSWTGIARDSICYCESCGKSFFEHSGLALPEACDYNDPAYRHWISWSYKCRTDNWDLFNRITREFGGEDCLWLGMVNANFVSSHASFCDLRKIAKRSKIFMVDHQGRDGNGYEQNSLNGVLLHQLIGWDKIIPESMSGYVRGLNTFRRAANPQLELWLWMLSGFAGGISPWWHIVGGLQEDRRVFANIEPMMQWHRDHEEYLFNRTPISDIGVLWSQANVEFYGGLNSKDRLELSWRGINMALTRAGLPFVPINCGDAYEQASGKKLLILPELAVIDEALLEFLEQFVESGGSLLVIGAAGILDADGNPYEKSCLERLLGAAPKNPHAAEGGCADGNWENPSHHSYIRIEGAGRQILKGFESTDIIGAGGEYSEIVLGEAEVLATYIPPFPIYPPEFAWTDTKRTHMPVIMRNRPFESGGAVIYAAFDLDAVYGKNALPDHGGLIADMVEFLLDGHCSVKAESEFYIDFKIYRQQDRIIIHLINSKHTGFDHGYAEKNIPAGRVSVHFKGLGFTPKTAFATEDGICAKLDISEGGFSVCVEKICIHQLIVIESITHGLISQG